MVDLLDGAPGEAGVVFDQILEVGRRTDGRAADDRLVPGQIGPGPHGVHTRQAPHVPREDPAESEHEAGRGDDRPVSSRFGIVGIAPQRVVIADPVGVMANVVAGCLVTPRLDRGRHRDPDEPA